MTDEPLTTPSTALDRETASELGRKYVDYFTNPDMSKRIEGIMAFAADIANAVAEKHRGLVEAADEAWNALSDLYGDMIIQWITKGENERLREFMEISDSAIKRLETELAKLKETTHDQETFQG